MRTNKAGIHLLLAVAIMIVGEPRIVCGDDEEDSNPIRNYLESLVPKGAKIYFHERLSKEGRVVCRQQAVYETDLDGDGDFEVIILTIAKEEHMVDMLRAIVVDKVKEKTGLTKQVVQRFELDGSYLWDNDAVNFVDLDGDGSTEAVFSAAMSASCGPHLNVISKKAGHGEEVIYEASSPYFNSDYTKVEGNKLLVKQRHKKDWERVVATRNDQGSLRITSTP